MTTSKTDKLAKRLADHGRHLFVYHQIWTNQVVYSLERSMNVAQNNQCLKQLTFAGKKTLPSALRKDMWRPLLTATFPSTSQGLSAFRKLRELRMLHEHNWEHPNPEAQKLPEKKQRGFIIMDQKANSIADLAWVLRHQEELGVKKQQQNEREQNRIREELLALAKEAQDGGLPLLEQSLKDQEATVEMMKQLQKEGGDDAPSRKVIGDKLVALKAMRLRHQKMLAADEVINLAKSTALGQSAALEARGSASPDSVDLTVEPPEIFYHPPIGSRQNKRRTPAQQVPQYTAEGVVIRWTNPLDAEFAAEWPAAVRHDAAGLARHTAAPIDKEPAFYVQEMIERNTSSKYTQLREERARAAEESDGEDIEIDDAEYERLMGKSAAELRA
ncbi:hypothetical protein E4T38_09321 [Aureobasidium subglaciale]|nr:hypothetical protein E4T38_09321 [Aureobasidium subglaciale]KAI5213994.1 hypothetical protein E4T40_09272 [Aureobasidium subglaciale]KAI5216410.1 hypothetical protein E4T41_09273 [Aureobasidium subglaciale]KAI5254229.1 hypothetical protein E4T46_09228 [Aureobasidium subglaciale]